MKFIIAFLLAVIVWLALSCNQGDSSEAQKLLDKQAALQQEGQQNLEETKEYIVSTLDEMGALEDSLISTKEQILKQRENLQDEAAKLEAENLQLRLERQQDQLAKLTARRDSLNEALANTDASLIAVKKDSANISRSKDSLQTKGEVLSKLDEEMKVKLVTGIEVIDAKLEELDKEKKTAISRISLNEKKVTVAEKKVEVLTDEKKLYENQKLTLWDDGAPQSEIDAVSDIIASVEKNIDAEKQKIKQALEAISDLQETVDDIDKQRRSLSEKIRKNYTTQEILSEYMMEEQVRLKKELIKLDTVQQKTMAEREAIALEKKELEKRLSGLQEIVSITEHEQLAALEEKKAVLEKESSSLEQEEENLEIAAGEKTLEPGEEAGYNSEVEKLEAEYKAKQQALAQEKAELARQRKELAMQKEAASLKKAQRKKKASYTALVLLGIGVLAIVGLYFLGRYRKSKGKNKA